MKIVKGIWPGLVVLVVLLHFMAQKARLDALKKELINTNQTLLELKQMIDQKAVK